MSLAKKPSTAFSHELEVGVKWKVQRGWRASHRRTFGVLVGGIVVHDRVDELAGRDVALQRVEEADELLMPVALHVSAGDCAVQHVERGEQRGGAVALVIVGHGAPRPFFSGRPGWVRSSAWICDFSSIDSTTAWAGGAT